MAIPQTVAAQLQQSIHDRIMRGIKPKFDAYFTFTSSAQGQCQRSYPDGKNFRYSDASMISDLTVLWSLFNDLYEAVHGPARLASIIVRDPYLQSQLFRIVEGAAPDDQDGSFWIYQTNGIGQVPLQAAMQPANLSQILRTMRNGFAHFNWHYDDLSALDYWQAQGWSVANHEPAFQLLNRGKRNYMAYIADAKPWKPERFWQMTNLRILVTHYGVLRYHLHLLLNYILNGNRNDVFTH